ncbi:MAG: DUF3048 domain-containing protein [Lachnospiraceae bacterium]
MKRHVRAAALCLAGVLLFAGCGKKTEEPVQQPKETVVEEPSKEPSKEAPSKKKTEDHTNEARNPLTGEWISKEAAAQRPFACMMGNTSDAQPQYGIGDADVIYEAPVEGSFTRLMVLFQDYQKVERVESIRSCRLYFAYFAKEFDAIYAHWGQAIYANDMLSRMDDLDAEDGALNGSFHRDPDRRSPHNGYTTGADVVAGIAAKGYSTAHSETYQEHYTFNKNEKKDVIPSGAVDAAVVQPGYVVNKPWFSYDEKSGLYQRFQFGEPQIDAKTNQQVGVKNVILQYTPWHNEDDNGYLYFETVASGTGKYLTNGKAIDITWQKENEDSPTKYFDASGNEITLNQGKTWVCIVQDSKADGVQVYGTKEEFEGK